MNMCLCFDSSEKLEIFFFHYFSFISINFSVKTFCSIQFTYKWQCMYLQAQIQDLYDVTINILLWICVAFQFHVNRLSTTTTKRSEINLSRRKNTLTSNLSASNIFYLSNPAKNRLHRDDKQEPHTETERVKKERVCQCEQ